jgi:hypothetical protein
MIIIACIQFVNPGVEINQPQDIKIQLNYFFATTSLPPLILPHTVQR